MRSGKEHMGGSGRLASSHRPVASNSEGLRRWASPWSPTRRHHRPISYSSQLRPSASAGRLCRRVSVGDQKRSSHPRRGRRLLPPPDRRRRPTPGKCLPGALGRQWVESRRDRCSRPVSPISLRWSIGPGKQEPRLQRGGCPSVSRWTAGGPAEGQPRSLLPTSPRDHREVLKDDAFPVSEVHAFLGRGR